MTTPIYYHRDQLLTLTTGEVWKVHHVYTSAGRPAVALVNPDNPKHGTAFYAEDLDKQVVRPGLQRELRESVDGVLAVRDPRRTGVHGRRWLVIDAPPGHRTHWRDQRLSDLAVQDWAVLTREPQPTPQELQP